MYVLQGHSSVPEPLDGPAIEVGAARLVPCEDPESAYRCGETDLSIAGIRYIADFVVYGAAEDPLVAWLPGGPNERAARLLRANAAYVLSTFAETQIFGLDPPQVAEGGTERKGCEAEIAQRQFQDSLGNGIEETLALASVLVEACQDLSLQWYGSEAQAEVLRVTANLLQPQAAFSVCAASADSGVALHLLRSSGDGTVERVLLDSPIEPFTTGVEAMHTQVQGLITAKERMRLETPILGFLDEFGWDASSLAYVVTVLRAPNFSADERVDLLETRRIVDVIEVRDQYFRRYADTGVSYLNLAYYAGFCAMFDWPSDSAYAESMSDEHVVSAVDVALAEFVYGYHAPCIYWPETQNFDDTSLQNVGNVQVALLQSRLDPIVGAPESFVSDEVWQVDLVEVVETEGHRSILASGNCTWFDVFETLEDGGSCQ